ncbi:MAG: AAA family ATPase [Candidatus Aminicenantales bacterium]
MKIAISGKGGTGKSTIGGLLAHYFKNDGFKVLAVDADPDANLASAIGIPPEIASSITPISKQRKLVQERTGARPRQFGQLFKINPVVDDIPDAFCLNFQGIKLLVLGAVRKGGSGCACPENVLLRSLLSEIILHRHEVVLVDMEPGIEHLGRGTAQAIDKMLIIVEPGWRSVSTARSIMKLAKEIGVYSFGIIGNKVHGESQEKWLRRQFSPDLWLGAISYHDLIQQADLKQKPLIKLMNDDLRKEFDLIYKALRGSSLPPAVQ